MQHEPNCIGHRPVDIAENPHLPNRTRDPGSKAYLLLLAALLVTNALTWLPRMGGPIDLRGDASVYYILGTSLAEGKGYRLLNEPGDIRDTQYPPLLPAIIGLHQRLLASEDPAVVGPWLNVSWFLLTNLYAVVFFSLLRNYLPLSFAFLAALLSILNMVVLRNSGTCVTELPFAVSTAIFFWCARKNTPLYTGFAALAATASYLLRTAGIAIFAAWVFESVMARRWKQTLFRSVAVCVPVLCWFSYVAQVESAPDYKSPFYVYQRADYLFYNISYARNMSLKDPFHPELGRATFVDLLRRSIQNRNVTPSSLGALITYQRPSETQQHKVYTAWRVPVWLMKVSLLVLPVIAFVIGCLILCGLGLLLKDKEWLLGLYLLLSLVIIWWCPWPGSSRRYLSVLIPFLLAALFKVILISLGGNPDSSSARILSRTRQGLTFSLVFLILACEAILFFFTYREPDYHKMMVSYGGGRTVETRLPSYAGFEPLDEALDWLQTRTPSETVVSWLGPFVYLRTGLKTVMPPFEADPVEFQRLVDSIPAAYLMVDDWTQSPRCYSARVVEAFPLNWKPVFSAKTGKVEIYERLK